jgi:formylglycine-generating enzyme required for sulfatase activity
MGRSTNGTDAYPGGNANELPEHMATVATFAFDSFEVTVGRFRRFVSVYDATPPAAGVGAHPLIANSGWQACQCNNCTNLASGAYRVIRGGGWSFDNASYLRAAERNFGVASSSGDYGTGFRCVRGG